MIFHYSVQDSEGPKDWPLKGNNHTQRMNRVIISGEESKGQVLQPRKGGEEEGRLKKKDSCGTQRKLTSILFFVS